MTGDIVLGAALISTYRMQKAHSVVWFLLKEEDRANFWGKSNFLTAAHNFQRAKCKEKRHVETEWNMLRRLIKCLVRRILFIKPHKESYIFSKWGSTYDGIDSIVSDEEVDLQI